MQRQPCRLLLIEDDPAHRYIYRRFLEQREGPAWEVHEAPSAAEALAACAQLAPHCILLDYRLPDGDGLALLRQLRSLTAAPVIFITAHPEPLTMTKAFGAGATRYLSKDFLSAQTLNAAVAEALER